MLIPTHRVDLRTRAVELEHETFRNAKMANLYKASVLKKVGLGGIAHLLAQGRKEQPLHTPNCLPAAWFQEPFMSIEPAFRTADICSHPKKDWNLSSVQFFLCLKEKEDLDWGYQEELMGAMASLSVPS